MAERRKTLLCSTNFPAGTGYAWNFIEALYAGVADRLAAHGVRTLVAYPGLDAPPATLEGSAATAIDHPFRPGRGGGTGRAVELVRREGIDAVYLADRPVWHPGYATMRRAGVSRIVVHDHTSGLRTRPRGVRRIAKRARLAVPGTLADEVVAVSDFVAKRKVEVDLVPPERVTRIWNSVVIERGLDSADPDPGSRAELGEELAVAPDRPIVLCVCRATEEKGVDHALRAFDRLVRTAPEGPRPVFVHAGDGPALEALRRLRETLASSEDIHLLGYRNDVRRLIDAASVCIAPSVWAEAFGLSALEPMARRRAVIASAIGGLPEVVGDAGILVPPADEAALGDALDGLLRDAARRRDLAGAGYARALDRFEREAQLDRLARVVGRGLVDGWAP